MNQYSEDVVSSWRNKINNSLSENGIQLINAFLNTYGTVNYLFITDSLDSKDIKIYSRQSTIENQRKEVAELLTSKESLIKKLYEYKKSGYLKLEPVNISRGNSAILFLLDDNSLCGIIFTPESFINKFLGSKMHSIAGN